MRADMGQKSIPDSAGGRGSIGVSFGCLLGVFWGLEALEMGLFWVEAALRLAGGALRREGGVEVDG